MSKSRNLSDLLDANGDVVSGALDNVASDSISDSGGTARVEATTSGANVTGDLQCDSALINGGSSWGKIELGGDLGAYLDFKAPYSDDYDYRIQYFDTDNTTKHFAPSDLSFIVNGTNRLTLGTRATFVGNIQHDGLTMTTGTDIDQVKGFALAMGAMSANTFYDTGVDYTDLATGTYIVSLHGVSDHVSGGAHYDEVYSGIMSWYNGSTNSPEVDDLILHSAGHADNGRSIFLRTKRNTSGVLKLQIAHSHGTTSSYTYNIKFRRML
jgi:hypothetical protein